jgi:hypothetical protein
LFSDLNAAENTTSNQIESFDANGFFVFGNRSATNRSGQDYVAWCWKGSNADAVSNSSGMGSEISANDKGFSIVKYTGSGSSGTVAHGLTIDGTATKPELSIFKATNANANWFVLTDVIDNSADYLTLNSTAAKVDLASGWLPDTTNLNFPTSSGLINNSNGTQEMIVYCFASVSGYSKIGSYSGTSASNNRIYTTDDGTSTGSGGFEPSWLMIKRTTGAGWYIIDNKRSTVSDKKDYLQANSNGIEAASSTGITFNSDGFTFNGASFNLSSDTHIYMAFK